MLSEVCGVEERGSKRCRARVFGHQPHVKPHAPLSQYDADIEPTQQTDPWAVTIITIQFAQNAYKVVIAMSLVQPKSS